MEISGKDFKPPGTLLPESSSLIFVLIVISQTDLKKYKISMLTRFRKFSVPKDLKLASSHIKCEPLQRRQTQMPTQEKNTRA